LFSFQSDQIATRDFHEGGLWQERGSGQADAETPATGLAATADKQIAEMNRGKLRVFRGKLGVSAGLRGGRGLRRCVWRSLLRIGEDHLGPLSEPESLGAGEKWGLRTFQSRTAAWEPSGAGIAEPVRERLRA